MGHGRQLLTVCVMSFVLVSTDVPTAIAGAKPVPIAGAPWREVTLPAGTVLPVVLDTSIGSATSRIEQTVRGHLARATVVDGFNVFPRGTPIQGIVTAVRRSGKVKGRAHVSMRFTTIDPAGDERYRLQTRAIGRTAPATKKADAVKIGAPAAGGAVVGGILGGKQGAAIGAATGGGAGTAVVLSTRGKETGFARGSTVSVRLIAPVTVRVRG